jgi:arginase
MPANGITIICSPYHVGIRDHRVGNGPNRIRSLENLGVNVKFPELAPVDEFEGEIGRSFELLRRLSKAVADNTFPLVLSGNCMAGVGIACGL